MKVILLQDVKGTGTVAAQRAVEIDGLVLLDAFHDEPDALRGDDRYARHRADPRFASGKRDE